MSCFVGQFSNPDYLALKHMKKRGKIWIVVGGFLLPVAAGLVLDWLTPFKPISLLLDIIAKGIALLGHSITLPVWGFFIVLLVGPVIFLLCAKLRKMHKKLSEDHMRVLKIISNYSTQGITSRQIASVMKAHVEMIELYLADLRHDQYVIASEYTSAPSIYYASTLGRRLLHDRGLLK